MVRQQILATAAVVFFSLQASLGETTKDSKDCSLIADVVFLIDGSTSVEKNFADQLRFVEMMAIRLNISDSGSNAAVIQFSSEGHISVPIGLKEFTEISTFLHALQSLKSKGGETRIDLALDKAHQEIFNNDNGNRKQIIVLLTDGVQYPVRHRQTGRQLDPAHRSRLLRKQGVVILAVGVGLHTNLTQLTEITGSRDKVFNSANFKELISDSFVETFGHKLCQTGNEITTVRPTGNPAGCNNCGCSQRPIYVNIFLGGQSLVFQALNTSSLNSDKADIINVVSDSDGQVKNDVDLDVELSGILKNIFPEDSELVDLIKEQAMMSQKIPSAKLRIRRRREILRTEEKLRMSKDKYIDPISAASRADAGLIAQLHSQEILLLLQMYKAKPNLTLILPSDEAILLGNDGFGINVGNQKSWYLVEPLDNVSSYFKPVNGGPVLRTYEDASGDMVTGIENTLLAKKPFKAGNLTIFITKERLLLPRWNLYQTIKSIPHLSIFTKMMTLADMELVINQAAPPSQFCVRHNVCFPWSSVLKSRLEFFSQMKQFTIFAPSNEAIKSIPKRILKAIMVDKKKLRNVLGSHTIFGTIFRESINEERSIVSPSLGTDNLIHTAYISGGNPTMKYSDLARINIAKVIYTDIRSTNAIVHVVDKFLIPDDV